MIKIGSTMVDPFTYVDECTLNDFALTESASAYKLEISLSQPDKIKKIFSDYFILHPQSIPKIIHQVWIGPYPPPWKWINSFRVDFMHRFPDWKYKLWREDNIAGLQMANKDL